MARNALRKKPGCDLEKSCFTIKTEKKNCLKKLLFQNRLAFLYFKILFKRWQKNAGDSKI